MKLYKTLGMFVLLASSSLSFAQTQKEMDQLKGYRTYYYLETASYSAHQFEVWYFSKENQWEVALVAAKANDDLSNIKPDQYLVNHTAYAGWPSPEVNYTKVPAELQQLEVDLVQAIKKNHGELNLEQVQVHYLGEFARVAVREITPQSVNPIRRGQRSASMHEKFFAVDVKNNTLTDLQMGGGGSSTLEATMHDGTISSQWIDYSLPSSVEGSQLFALDFQSSEEVNLPNIYNLEVKNLEAAILDAAVKADPSTSDSILNKILTSQSSELPTGPVQYQSFDLNMYGRADDRQLDVRVQFLIPVTSKDFSISKVDKASGITFTIKGNLTEGTFAFSAQDQANNEINLEKPIDKKYYSMISTSSDAAFIEGFLEFERNEDEEDKQLSLPGSGEYSSFDIYLGRFDNYQFTAKDLQ